MKFVSFSFMKIPKLCTNSFIKNQIEGIKRYKKNKKLNCLNCCESPTPNYSQLSECDLILIVLKYGVDFRVRC